MKEKRYIDWCDLPLPSPLLCPLFLPFFSSHRILYFLTLFSQVTVEVTRQAVLEASSRSVFLSIESLCVISHQETDERIYQRSLQGRETWACKSNIIHCLLPLFHSPFLSQSLWSSFCLLLLFLVLTLVSSSASLLLFFLRVPSPQEVNEKRTTEMMMIFSCSIFSIKEKEEVRREEEINDRAMHKTWHTHLAFGCHPFFQDIIISCVHRTTDVKYSFCDRDWRQIRRQIFLESLSLLSVTDRFLKLWRGNRFDVVSLSFCCQSPSLVSSMEWEVSTFSSPMKSVCEFTDKRVKEERARKLLKRDRQLENWVKPTGILSSSLALFLHSINFVQSFERKRKKEKRKETSEIEARKEIELKGESKMFVSFPHFLEWCLLLVFRVLRHTILSGIPLESRFNIPITSTDVKFLLTPSSCDETNPQEARMLFSPRFTWSVIVYSLIIRLNYWEIKRSLRWWWSGRGYYTKVIATSSSSSGKEGIYSVSLDPLDMICVSFIPCVSWHRLIFVCVFLLLNFSLPFIGILTANDFCMIIETCISWYDVVTDICNLWSSRKGWASFSFRDEAFSLCFRVFNQFHHKRQKGRNTLWSISSWDLCTYFGFFLLLGLGCWCSSRKIKHHSHEQSAYQTNIKSRDWTWEVSKVETRSFAKKEEACSNKVNCASNIIHI